LTEYMKLVGPKPVETVKQAAAAMRQPGSAGLSR
jgi:hypothetical protein